MQKYISALIAMGTLIFANNALAACSVQYATTPDVLELVKQRGGWPLKDSQCNFLEKNKLYINVAMTSTVLAGTSLGWVAVALVDENNIKSDHLQKSTYVNSSTASMDFADGLAYKALKDAVANFDFEKAAKEIATYQKAAKNAH